MDEIRRGLEENALLGIGIQGSYLKGVPVDELKLKTAGEAIRILQRYIGSKANENSLYWNVAKTVVEDQKELKKLIVNQGLLPAKIEKGEKK